MENAPSPTPLGPSPPSSLQWGKTLGLWALAILGAPLLAAHFPPRLKLIGLFSFGLALVATWLIMQGGRLSAVSRRGVSIVLFVGLPVLFALYLGESFRHWRATEHAEMRQHILGQPGGAALWDQLQQSDEKLTEFEREMALAYRRRLSPTFSDYLRERSELTIPIRREPLRLSPTGTMTLIVGEVLLGLLAGGLFLRWTYTPAQPATTQNQRNQEQDA